MSGSDGDIAVTLIVMERDGHWGNRGGVFELKIHCSFPDEGVLLIVLVPYCLFGSMIIHDTIIFGAVWYSILKC